MKIFYFVYLGFILVLFTVSKILIAYAKQHGMDARKFKWDIDLVFTFHLTFFSLIIALLLGLAAGYG